jgi:hypothetical protein
MPGDAADLAGKFRKLIPIARLGCSQITAADRTCQVPAARLRASA